MEETKESKVTGRKEGRKGKGRRRICEGKWRKEGRKDSGGGKSGGENRRKGLAMEERTERGRRMIDSGGKDFGG